MNASDLQQSIQPQLWAVEIITYLLAWAAIALRFIARRSGGTKLWWDDWCILLFYVRYRILCQSSTDVPKLPFSIVSVGNNITLTALGAGKHFELVVEQSPQNVPLLLKVSLHFFLIILLF